MFHCTVDNTSMNPSLFGKTFLLIFSGSIWATDKSNTNFRILISRALRWANDIFTLTNTFSKKKFKNSQKQKSFVISQINGPKSCFELMSAVELVKSKIWFSLLKALEMRIENWYWTYLSVAQILSEKINKMFLPNKLGFIDVLSIVCML